MQENEPMVINGLDYATVVCCDVGLRCLSQRLLSISISDIGRCLGLDESFIQCIEEDSTHDGQHKRQQLLTEWRCRQVSPTWGMVASCFKSLNDETLMEGIRQIASEMQTPEDQGMTSDPYSQCYCVLFSDEMGTAVICECT